MTAFDARYYDGRSSNTHAVRVRVTADGGVHIAGDGVDMSVPRDGVRVSARLGNSPRYLYLPDGQKCESTDHDAMDAAFAEADGLVHRLERRWPLALAAAAVTAALLWLGFSHALPVMARHAAYAIPAAVEIQMGRQSLATLDRHLLEATALGDMDRARLQSAFTRVAATIATELPLTLEVRRSDALGANALALPSGIIVVTDAMVELADDDQQLMAVIAHEVGHVHHRHIMRSILQNSAAAVLVAALLGDVTSVTGLAASVPTFLVEQHYSREFELEADRFALAWMSAQGIPGSSLAEMLSRLSEKAGPDARGLQRYLSTHPSTRERIEAIER